MASKEDEKATPGGGSGSVREAAASHPSPSRDEKASSLSHQMTTTHHDDDHMDGRPQDRSGGAQPVVVVVPGLLPRALPFKSRSWQERHQVGERRHFKRLRQMIALDNELAEKERERSMRQVSSAASPSDSNEKEEETTQTKLRGDDDSPSRGKRRKIGQPDKEEDHITTKNDTTDTKQTLPPIYSSYDVGPSLRPRRKYSDLSGLEAPYTDPRTKLFYSNVAELKTIRSLASSSPGYIEELLEMRGAVKKVG